MPHKDPEVRKKYLKEWYRKNTKKIQQYSKDRWKKIKSSPKLYQKEKERHREQNSKPKQKLQQKDYFLRCAYGITLKDYNRMFAEQQGCCAICGMHQSNWDKALHVDHNHRTGKVRQLLCAKCNRYVGVLEESELLIDIIKYLEKHE